MKTAQYWSFKHPGRRLPLIILPAIILLAVLAARAAWPLGLWINRGPSLPLLTKPFATHNLIVRSGTQSITALGAIWSSTTVINGQTVCVDSVHLARPESSDQVSWLEIDPQARTGGTAFTTWVDGREITGGNYELYDNSGQVAASLLEDGPAAPQPVSGRLLRGLAPGRYLVSLVLQFQEDGYTNIYQYYFGLDIS